MKGTMATCHGRAQSPQKPDEPFRRLVARQPRCAREESTRGISVLGQQSPLATAESTWLDQTLTVPVPSRAGTSHAALHKEGPGTLSQPMQVTCVPAPVMFHLGPRTTEADTHSALGLCHLWRQELQSHRFFWSGSHHSALGSAPEWAFSITNLRVTTAALVVILPDLAVMPPLSQLIWDPHCSSIHPPGHFSPLQLLLKPLLPYVKWDSPFLPQLSKARVYLELEKSQRAQRRKSLHYQHIILQETGKDSGKSYLSNWWLCTSTSAALLHLSILEEWDSFTHTHLWSQVFWVCFCSSVIPLDLLPKYKQLWIAFRFCEAVKFCFLNVQVIQP